MTEGRLSTTDRRVPQIRPTLITLSRIRNRSVSNPSRPNDLTVKAPSNDSWATPETMPRSRCTSWNDSKVRPRIVFGNGHQITGRLAAEPCQLEAHLVFDQFRANVRLSACLQPARGRSAEDDRRGTPLPDADPGRLGTVVAERQVSGRATPGTLTPQPARWRGENSVGPSERPTASESSGRAPSAQLPLDRLPQASHALDVTLEISTGHPAEVGPRRCDPYHDWLLLDARRAS